MYNYIKGTLVEVGINSIVLENNGIGYELGVSGNTLADARDIGGQMKLHTYLYVREDTFALYGFSRAEEKALFMRLIEISGIGPKLAMQILSGYDLNTLTVAIATGDVKTLAKIKGLGKKTAELIVLNLREQLADDMTAADNAIGAAMDSDLSDAIFALVSLGVLAIKAAQEAGKKISYRLIYTGRQDDTSLDASLFSDLDMKRPDGYLGVTGHDHSEVAAAIMLAFEKELNNHPAQVVLVVDDLTATMSCSIVAKKRGLKVAHLIAGTRSFDMNMPREVNRTIVDAISDYLFTAGMVANRNLNQEGMIPEYIHYVGNILIDTVRYNRHRLLQPVWFSTIGLEKRGYLLLTLNRHDLLTKKHVLKSLIQTLIHRRVLTALHF